jgi:hypothetical protein
MSKEPVASLISVKIERMPQNPDELRISALAWVSTLGWTDPELVPRTYVRPPDDGIYDLDFVAEPPRGPVGQALARMEVKHNFRASPGLKGVRIHASTNSMEAQQS